jgi:outer membrane immunogenic protein
MRLRSILIAASIACVTAGSFAWAADLPMPMPTKSRMPTKAYPSLTSVEPVSTWSGFYAGVHAGYGWAKVNDVTAGGSSGSINGFSGGGQLGYNWQTGVFVLGVEADIQGTAQKRSDSFTILGIPFTVDQKIPWFATARGRIGYAAGPWLLYATGGAAWINYKLTVSAPGASASDNTTKAAFVVGGGVEWMMMQNWSAKLEYLYMDTGNTSVTLAGVPFTARAKESLLRAGLNYHF